MSLWCLCPSPAGESKSWVWETISGWGTNWMHFFSVCRGNKRNSGWWGNLLDMAGPLILPAVTRSECPAWASSSLFVQYCIVTRARTHTLTRTLWQLWSSQANNVTASAAPWQPVPPAGSKWIWFFSCISNGLDELKHEVTCKDGASMTFNTPAARTLSFALDCIAPWVQIYRQQTED